ncbi:MAG: membrane lipoprotein lipid attachment site-containing protein [Lachnospiraceae bacterium]|nr:membrane lipoprotein lipid attachment site-containing protein [Lachnospiraceae bacterium]
MKKTIAALFALSVLAGCSGCGGDAPAHQWEKVGENGKTEFFIDKSSITGKQVKTFWQKDIPIGEYETHRTKGEYEISLLSIDCKKNTLSQVARYKYKNGEHTFGGEIKNPEAHFIIPETLGEAFQRYVCR